MMTEPLLIFGLLGSLFLIIAGAWNHEPWVIVAGLLVAVIYWKVMGDE